MDERDSYHAAELDGLIKQAACAAVRSLVDSKLLPDEWGPDGLRGADPDGRSWRNPFVEEVARHLSWYVTAEQMALSTPAQAKKELGKAAKAPEKHLAGLGEFSRAYLHDALCRQNHCASLEDAKTLVDDTVDQIGSGVAGEQLELIRKACADLAQLSVPKGRPRESWAFDRLVRQLAHVYECATGKRAGTSHNHDDTYRGLFVDFVHAAVAPLPTSQGKRAAAAGEPDAQLAKAIARVLESKRSF